jgi:hypothetical protein
VRSPCTTLKSGEPLTLKPEITSALTPVFVMVSVSPRDSPKSTPPKSIDVGLT